MISWSKPNEYPSNLLLLIVFSKSNEMNMSKLALDHPECFLCCNGFQSSHVLDKRPQLKPPGPGPNRPTGISNCLSKSIFAPQFHSSHVVSVLMSVGKTFCEYTDTNMSTGEQT